MCARCTPAVKAAADGGRSVTEERSLNKHSRAPRRAFGLKLRWGVHELGERSALVRWHSKFAAQRVTERGRRCDGGFGAAGTERRTNALGRAEGMHPRPHTRSPHVPIGVPYKHPLGLKAAASLRSRPITCPEGLPPG